MNDNLYIGFMVAVFAVQLLLGWKAKRRIVKWIPALLIVALMIGCVAAYAFSGGTNWAFLILMMLLFGLLVVDGTAWAISGIWRLVARSKER